jgi:hypothetical protein
MERHGGRRHLSHAWPAGELRWLQQKPRAFYSRRAPGFEGAQAAVRHRRDGAGGPITKYGPSQKRYAGIHGEFRKAMAAPAKLPEFKGNVTAVFTENYCALQLHPTPFATYDQRQRALAKRVGLEVFPTEIK